MTLLAWALLAAPPLLVLGVVLYNLAVQPRGAVDGRLPGRVSVLIPARDEAASIERCVRAALAQTRPPDEVVVCDDGSTDGTAEIVARLAEEDARVRLVRGGPLPPGWVGKPHACHRLVAEATGDLLVHLDADVRAEPECLARLGGLFDDLDADLVSASTRQRTVTWAERLVVPLLQLEYLAWLPLPLVWRSSDPRFLVANGQLLAVRRDALRRAGGWAAVRAEVVDDVALARRVKSSGGRVVFADGGRMARCRMYGGAGEVWRGFSKNLYEGIGGSPVALAGLLALHGWVFLLPYLALLAAALGAPVPLLPALVGVGANVAIRAAVAVRHRQPAEGVLLHPLSILALFAIALNSWRWSRGGRIAWRGRSYAGREARMEGEGSGGRREADPPASSPRAGEGRDGAAEPASPRRRDAPTPGPSPDPGGGENLDDAGRRSLRDDARQVVRPAASSEAGGTTHVHDPRSTA